MCKGQVMQRHMNSFIQAYYIIVVSVLVAPQINNPCISTSSTTNIESTYESTTTTGHNTSPRWTTTISQDNTSHSGTTTTSQYNTSTSWVRSSPTSAAVSVSSETKENTISSKKLKFFNFILLLSFTPTTTNLC